MFKKKKKTEKEVIDEVLPEPEETLPKPPKAAPKKEPEPKGEFSLSTDEMTLAVNALVARPELKVYNDFIVGQRIAEIISAYNKAIGTKAKDTPVEETDEEKLPEA